MTVAPTPPTVLGYVGPAGDHNEHPWTSVPQLLAATGELLGREHRTFGTGLTRVVQSSLGQLRDARGWLVPYGAAVAEQLDAGHRAVCVAGRCAASIATLPRLVRARPDAVVLWLDAHADLNVPGDSPTDYLGGMAVAGPLGWWETGLGAGLDPDGLVLLGTRAIDDAEQRRIIAHDIAVIPPEDATPAAVLEAVASRPVWFHLDCDVLEPGVFTTDYREPDGMSLERLGELAAALAAEVEVVGVEIAEWEGPGERSAGDLLDALAPLLRG